MDNKKTKELIKNVLNLLLLEDDKFTIVVSKDGSIQISIALKEDSTGIFIGRRGENIVALRLIISLMLSQRNNQWPKLRLNINDYQEKREEFLINLAEDAVKKALELQREIILPNLSSYERRIIHLHVENLGTVTTESRGEEPQRQLVIIPKSK